MTIEPKTEEIALESGSLKVITPVGVVIVFHLDSIGTQVHVYDNPDLNPVNTTILWEKE